MRSGHGRGGRSLLRGGLLRSGCGRRCLHGGGGGRSGPGGNRGWRCGTGVRRFRRLCAGRGSARLRTSAGLLGFGSGARFGDALLDRGGLLHHGRAGLEDRRGRRGGDRRRRRQAERRRRDRRSGRGRGGDLLRQQRRCGKGQNSGNRGPGGADGANMSSHSEAPTHDRTIHLHQSVTIGTERTSLTMKG